MTNEEVIKMMEREKTRACFDCMHPQAVGYCEEVCRLPEAFDMAIEMMLYEIQDVLESLPSADAVEVVHCKDCRYCEEQGGHANCDGYLYCTRQKTLVDEGCYCSWGERREP